MTESDVEVVPRGTTEELKVLRKFAYSMMALNAIHDMPVPHEMRTKIDELNRFYNTHQETYPV